MCTSTTGKIKEVNYRDEIEFLLHHRIQGERYIVPNYEYVMCLQCIYRVAFVTRETENNKNMYPYLCKHEEYFILYIFFLMIFSPHKNKISDILEIKSVIKSVIMAEVFLLPGVNFLYG